jgi:hypothetical protein
MKNADEILKKILLNMKYDSSKSLNENKDLVLSEQSINVNKFTVSYEKDYNRIKITNPSGKTYYWTPKSNQWYTSSNYLGTEQFQNLDTTKDAKTISTLQSVLKKSGIGASFYLRNTEQGNAFRTWVNKKDPSFSKSINLNVNGVYNNENIYNAWVKYGDEYKKVLNANKPLSSDDKQTQTTIEDLKSKGFDASGAMSMNHAYALAAIRATKKLTDKISERIFGAGDSPYFVCVKKVGSTCSPGSYLITDSFNIGMAEKINSRKDPVSGDLKPPQYTLLTNFYFDWGKITNDLTNAFKYDKNAYNSELFPDGWWNWFTTYWGTDNVTKIKLSQNPKDIKVPGGGGGYPSGELTSSDVHTFLSVVELGAMLLAFIPSPLSPILWGISSAAGIADASTYFYEGDKYTGSMMLALEVIPGGELLKFFKGTKTAVKLGKEGTIDLLKRGSKGSLKGSEEIVYQDLKKELKTLEKEITQLAKKQITKNVIGNLTQNFIKITKNYSTIDKLKVFFHIIGTVWKKTGRLPKMAMSVGGTAVGIDKIYLAIFGRDEDRQKSDLRKIYYQIQGKGIPPEEFIKNVDIAQKYIASDGAVKDTVNFIDIADDKKIKESHAFLEEKWSNKPQDKKIQGNKNFDNSKSGFGDLTSVDNEPEITLKPKTPKDVIQNIEIEKLKQNKDDYDFFIWSMRSKKWNPVTFDEFITGKDNGYKVTYSNKLKK